MNRKQAICCVILLSAVAFLALFVLAVVNVWLMLLAALVLVLALGLAYRARPGMFEVLRRTDRRNGTPMPPRPPIGPTDTYIPNMILVDNATSRQIPILKPVFTIGRDPGCDYSVPDAPDISRVHIEIRYDENRGASYIIDKNSRNGTFVNGARLAPEKAKRLENGDLIQLGTMRFYAQYAHY